MTSCRSFPKENPNGTLDNRDENDVNDEEVVMCQSADHENNCGQQVEEHDFGWFEDFESPISSSKYRFALSSMKSASSHLLTRALTLPSPVTPPPYYILECSLETQQLWYSTAGRRPKQPLKERAFYEQLWRKNFESSQAHYDEPIEALVKHSSTALNALESHGAIVESQEKENLQFNGSIKFIVGNTKAKPLYHWHQRLDVIPRCEIRGEIVTRGKSPFSNSVSRSFLNSDIATMSLQMPCFRTIKSSEDGCIHAEFLIVVTLAGTIPVTFGIWRRHSQFQNFVNHIAEINSFSQHAQNCFKNTLISWECVLQRKRWFKSLDHDYLTLKCFLLERFIHDVLFETPSPEIITSFLDLSNDED
jgi:hypothetical protein